MKPKKYFWTADTLIVILLITCIALAVVVCVVKPVFLIPVVCIVIVIAVVMVFAAKGLRKQIRRLVVGKSTNESAISNLNVASVAVNENKEIIWSNSAFKNEFFGGEESGIVPINKIVLGLELKVAAETGGQNVEVLGKYYTVFCTKADNVGGLFLLMFVENTELKLNSANFKATRPTVLYITIDTYDEILKEMRESERAQIISKIDRMLEQYIGKNHGLLRRVSNSKYMAIVEEKYFKEIVNARFDILDIVKNADEETSSVSLSIGVGHKGKTLKECEEMAVQALDMALGRGGDQAAVKEVDGSYEFYGGVSRSIEKRTKVKSRIIASAIKELMQQCEQVLVMGHKNADMDSIGAAVGMLRFCRICKKPAAIVIDEKATSSSNLMMQLNNEGYGESMLSPDQALSVADRKTLLIVVDTHMRNLLESLEVYAACDKVVVIDHHRKMVGHIDNAVVFYHEPYASSASELVSELLQYVTDSKENKLLPFEAEALLAGIMLDTRTFSLHVGVRTFEAAAYLRRMGAQTSNVKKLFSTSMSSYLYRNHLVSEAQIEHGCAVVVSDKVPQELEAVAPQAANDLLTIDEVKASFVAIKDGDRIMVSARSMGEINVQLIMEKLGGGGHLTMAGAQLKGVDCKQANKQILKAILEYNEENEKKRPAMQGALKSKEKRK